MRYTYIISHVEALGQYVATSDRRLYSWLSQVDSTLWYYENVRNWLHIAIHSLDDYNDFFPSYSPESVSYFLLLWCSSRVSSMVRYE
jgi:hypothetical protein